MKKKLLLLSTAFFLLFNTINAQEFTISGGLRHSINVCANGDVYSWGNNTYGQLGRTGTNSVPANVEFPQGTKILAADAGTGNHTLAIDCNRNLWSWGQNTDGQLGNGVGGRSLNEVKTNAAGGANVAIPAKVLKGAQTAADGADGSAYLSDVKYVSAGSSVSFAIVGKERALMAWGSNIGIDQSQIPTIYFLAGILGNNDAVMAFSNTPVYVKTADGKVLKNVKQVEGSTNGGVAVTNDGKVYFWGLDYSQLKFSLAAAPIKTVNVVNQVQSDLTGIVEISSGETHTLAVSASGETYTWGGAWAGQTGMGVSVSFNYATQITAGQSNTITGNATNLVNVSRVSASQIGSAAVVTVPDGNSTKGYLYTFGGQGAYQMGGESGQDLSGQLGQGHNPDGFADGVTIKSPDLVDTFKLKTGTILRAKDVNVISVSDGAGVFYVIAQDKNTLQRTVFVMGANNQGQLGLNNSNQAVSYPTELTVGCDLAEPCPVVNLGPDKVVCSQFQELLRNNAVSYSSYSNKWTFIDALGTVSDVTPVSASSSLMVTKVGKYVLTATRGVAGGCNACETTSDTIEFKTEIPAFKAPSGITYCDNVAPECYVNTANPESRYAWYETYTSKDILAKSVGSEKVFVNFTGSVLKPDQKKYTLWVADSTIFKGEVARRTQLCSYLDPTYAIVTKFSTQFMVYNQFTLKDFKVRLFNHTEIPDIQNPDNFKVLINQVNVELCSGKLINGSYVPDQVIKTFTTSISVKRIGEYELIVPASYSFAGDAIGKNYFFRIKSITGEAKVDGAYYTCNQGYSTLNVNLPELTAAVTGTFVLDHGYTSTYGYIYGFRIEKGADSKCPRFPVEITENCIVTATEEARAAGAISIYPNPSESVVKVNAANFEKAILIDGSGREIDSFFTKEINIENYLSGMYYLKVQTKDKTEILKVLKQ